jgi:hypothetical protein
VRLGAKAEMIRKCRYGHFGPMADFVSFTALAAAIFEALTVDDLIV